MEVASQLAQKKILIIEDDRDMAKVLRSNLASFGYQVECVFDGATGLGYALGKQYDLIVLDLTLPEVGGLDICKKIRTVSPTQAIIMLTSRVSREEKLLGFQLGADDYVTKPFDMSELLARVAALLRRTEQRAGVAHTEKCLKIGPLEIDLVKRRVLINEVLLQLTATEFDLLVFLARHPGRPFSREELLNNVWGYTFGGYESTVNVHVTRLRSKIEPNIDQPLFIQTVWGVGYRFAEEHEVV